MSETEDPKPPAIESYVLSFRGQELSEVHTYRWTIERDIMNMMCRDPVFMEKLDQLEKLIQGRASVVSDKTQREFKPVVKLVRGWYYDTYHVPRLAIDFPEFGGLI